MSGGLVIGVWPPSSRRGRQASRIVSQPQPSQLRVGLAARKVVLRRPPISHVLSTAHDMGREYRIISAPRDTPVPVPAALAYCDDEVVNGRPFCVMDFVDGYVLRDAAQTRAALDEGTRQPGPRPSCPASPRPRS